MHIQFRVFAPDVDATPPTAYVRIWNLKTQTAEQVRNEFDTVTLQAGYDEVGTIFEGTIVQTKRGAANATDRYLDIMASDLDLFRNFTIVNQTLAAGANQKDVYDAIVKAGGDNVKTGSVPSDLGTGGTLPRGKVLFGMGREVMTGVAKNTDTTWFSQNGKINLVKTRGYLPGEIVVLNQNTGMIGVPETTNDGVEVKCLINPKIQVGCRVKIDNAQIANAKVNRDVADPRVSSMFPASLSGDGTYRVLVVEHVGDNRGTTYESTLTCLAVDASASLGSSVAT
jgi:hypothetical protein